MCLNLNESLSVWSKKSFRKSTPRKWWGGQRLGLELMGEQVVHFGAAGSAGEQVVPPTSIITKEVDLEALWSFQEDP